MENQDKKLLYGKVTFAIIVKLLICNVLLF